MKQHLLPSSSKDNQSIEPASLPPIRAPETKTKVHFNQQVNYYQPIPQHAWDKLSAEQICDLTKEMIRTADGIDTRHFDYAMELAKKRDTRDKLTYFIGGAIAILGIGGSIYLGANGHELVAICISLPLATLLSVVVGRRLL